MPKRMTEACYRRLKWHERLERLMRRTDWLLPSYAAGHEQEVRKLADRYAVLRAKSRSPRDRAVLDGLVFMAGEYARLCREVQTANRA